MSTTARTSADIILIGGGLAGATAAAVLARQGVRVMLVDRQRTYPACFKAEKIEPDQTELFKKFDLMDAFKAHTTGGIHHVLVAQNGKVLRVEQREQFGVLYQDMVNAVRAVMPSSVTLKIGRVQDIETEGELPVVTLQNGEQHRARLVALAAGTGGDLHSRLGMHKRMVQSELSVAFGFTIAQPDGQPFPFDAVTYYPDGCSGQIAYLTLFRIGTTMRANLFTFWPLNSDVTRVFVRDARRELLRLFPKLTRVIGDFEVVSRVETGRIDLYRMEQVERPGVVLLADAFQSVCPSTGTGLSKVLTDVDVLCHDCLPMWLATPGIDATKLSMFYENPRKRAVDDASLYGALHNRHLGTRNGPFWRAQRVRRRWTIRAAAGLRFFRHDRHSRVITNLNEVHTRP